MQPPPAGTSSRTRLGLAVLAVALALGVAVAQLTGVAFGAAATARRVTSMPPLP